MSSFKVILVHSYSPVKDETAHACISPYAQSAPIHVTLYSKTSRSRLAGQGVRLTSNHTPLSCRSAPPPPPPPQTLHQNPTVCVKMHRMV